MPVAIVSKPQAREKLVECLAIIDDAKKYGWRDEDYKKVEDNMLWVIQFLNCEQN